MHGVTASEIGAGLARWLRNHQEPDGRIRDPLHGDTGTYAAGLAALAFRLMQRQTGDASWMDACRRSAEFALRRPRTSEFDTFALLLLADDTQADDPGLSRKILRTVRPFHGRRLVSNNWIAMRAASTSLYARLTASPSHAALAQMLWRRVIGRQREDGLFNDAPAGEGAPVTYHAKFCAMLALEYAAHPDADLQSALKRGLETLYALVTPSGALVPYGRSRNTLFGHAAAAYALAAGGALFGDGRFQGAAARILRRIKSFQHDDGHVPAVLNAGEAAREDWDVYVNNPDYNAYAAALLLMAREAHLPTDADEPPAPPEPQVCQVGPIVTVRDAYTFAAFVGRGECAPFGTPFFCDHRTWALQPLWIEQKGRVLLEPEPYTWKGEGDRSALVDPACNRWMPYVEAGGLRYAMLTCNRIEVRLTEGTVQMEGSGPLTALLPVPRWKRALGSILFLLTGRPYAVFHMRSLPQASLRKHLRWNPVSGCAAVAASVHGELPQGARMQQLQQEIRLAYA
ncbi:MAG: hypothetical protein ACP5VE_15520 [Chthonomonadales bacterium]